MKAFTYRVLPLAGLLFVSAYTANAQSTSRPTHLAQMPDSSKVYTYVAKMPIYPGGLEALTADLRREFQVASTANGCATPAFPVFVRLIVGPSGYVYAARSLNAKVEDKRFVPTTATVNPPALPVACEAAIVSAARRLRRLQPGRQNNNPVTVELMVELLAGK
jgi:hypothetical protein